jgi:hypothetical protein
MRDGAASHWETEKAPCAAGRGSGLAAKPGDLPRPARSKGIAMHGCMKRAWAKALAAIAVVLLVAGVPTWALAETVEATFAMIGPDGAAWVAPETVEVERGTTATQLTLSECEKAGITCDYVESSWGNYFNGFARGGGEILGWDAATGAYWQLFVDGESSQVGADGVVIDEPTAVTWAYTASDTIPTIVNVATNPTTSHPALDATWPSYLGAAWTGSGRTPFSAGTGAWSTRLADPDEWWVYLSDPVCVGSKLWLAHGDELVVVNQNTGVAEKRVALNAATDSTCRLAYADGYVLVPLSGGSVQAVSATTYETAWVSDQVADGAQSLSPVAVAGGAAYVATTTAGWSGPATDGVLRAIDVATGAVLWSANNPRGAGYYWAGLCVDGSYGLIGDDYGTLAAVDLATGTEVTTLDLGAAVRSTPVLLGGAAYVTTTDGTLHKVAVGANGALSQAGSVKFADSSTGTCAVATGKLVVGGAVSGETAWHGRLAVVDPAAMTVAQTFDATDDGAALPGDVKSMPLVLGDHVWFTSNGEPGALYVADLTAGTCAAVYTPAGDAANWCMASPIPTSAGTIVYKNDSGYLFCVEAAADKNDSGETGSASGTGTQTGSGTGSNAGTGSDTGTGSNPTGASGSTGSTSVVPASTDAAASPDELEAVPDEAAPTGDTEVEGVAVATSLDDAGADEAASASTIALWPIALIVIGLALLAGVIVWYRRDKDR